MSDAWQQTACILCSVNCGIEVKVDDGHIAKVRGDRAHPGSRGYACEKAQRLDHYQNGRHRLSTPLRRRPDGTFEADRLGHRDPRDRREARPRPRHVRRLDDLLLRRRRAGESSRRRVQRRRPPRARLDLHLERARAGEDRRVLGRRPALRPAALPHDRRLRARRGGGLRRQEPVAVARLPARARDPARDRGRRSDRALIVIDPRRTETADLADIHLQREARHRRVLSRRAARRAGAGGPGRPRVPRASTR